MHPLPELTFNFAMLALTGILVLVGLALHRGGRLASHGAWGGWVALCCVPLVIDVAHAAIAT